MNTFPSRKFRALLSLGTAGLLAVTTYGQSTATTTKTDDKATTLEKFVVTGGYLPLSGAVAASPVISIDHNAIDLSGATDALQMVKQLTPLFAGNGNVGTELNNGGAGESNVALRNLSTLVLLNGRRIVNSPVSNGQAVDLNTIPTAMIERVEILKDGASTIYGSDAIGGVVNLILRKDFNGFEVNSRFGATGNGDYKTREVAVIAGVSLKGGSLTVAAQHFENTPLLTTDRPLTTMTPAMYTALGTAPGGIPASMSGSYPGRVASDIIAGSPLAVGAPKYNASITTPPAKTNPNAAPQTLAQLEAAGIYIPVSSTPLGQSVGSATILNTTLYGNPLIVPTKRNQFVMNGTKELMGKSFEAFGDFMFSQTTNGGSGLAPSPIAGIGAGGGNSLFIPANNPYNLFGVGIGLGAVAVPGFPQPAVRTRLAELGNRSSKNETNTFRSILGFRGDINDNYSWEVAYNYSRGSAVQRILGGANGANMNQLMVPLLNSTGGYTYNAAGKPLSIYTDASGTNLPVYNPFALPGFNDPASIDAIRATLFQSSESSLRGIDFLLRGKPFALPAGDVAFALGAESRREDLSTAVDALFANGLALGYNPANTFSGGGRSNKAAFLETNIPVTSAKSEVVGFHQVDLTAAIRYEKISPGGEATTPKFGLRWRPIDDSIVIRSTWSKGFIAPSIYNLFGPSAGNSPSFTILEGTGGSGSGGSKTNTVTGQYGSAVELSNPGLAPSKSKSLTFGFVLSPKEIKGLSVSFDYYRITQDKVGAIDYTSVYADLNVKGSASKYAAGYVFADGSKITSTAPNQVNSTNAGTLTILKDFNGDLKTSGLDIGVDYLVTTDNYGRINVGANTNVLFDYKARSTSHDPYYQYARVFTDSTNGIGNSQGLLASYTLKPYINHTWRSLSTALAFTYLPGVSAPGTLFGDQSKTNAQRLDGKAYQIPSYFTTDLTVRYMLPNFGVELARNVSVTVGANNLFNKKPLYVPGGGNDSSENNTAKAAYDIIGRFMFVELKKSF